MIVDWIQLKILQYYFIWYDCILSQIVKNITYRAKLDCIQLIPSSRIFVVLENDRIKIPFFKMGKCHFAKWRKHMKKPILKNEASAFWKMAYTIIIIAFWKMVGFGKIILQNAEKTAVKFYKKSFFKMVFFDKSVKTERKSSGKGQNIPKFYTFPWFKYRLFFLRFFGKKWRFYAEKVT